MVDANEKAALVLGASGGIGSAICRALQRGGFERVETLSRRKDGLDVREEASVARAAEGLAARGARFQMVFNAVGTLEGAGRRPEKAFAEIEPEAMADALAVNAIGGALVIKHFAPLLAEKERSVFATLSARVGSIADNRLGGWTSYRASKAALNQIIRCAAIEIARSRPEAIVVALHPGTIDTALTKKYARGRYTASPDDAAAQMLAALSALSPEETGGFIDYAGEPIAW